MCGAVQSDLSILAARFLLQRPPSNRTIISHYRHLNCHQPPDSDLQHLGFLHLYCISPLASLSVSGSRTTEASSRKDMGSLVLPHLLIPTQQVTYRCSAKWSKEITEHETPKSQPRAGGSVRLVSRDTCQPIRPAKRCRKPRCRTTFPPRTGLRVSADRSLWCQGNCSPCLKTLRTDLVFHFLAAATSTWIWRRLRMDLFEGTFLLELESRDQMTSMAAPAAPEQACRCR